VIQGQRAAEHMLCQDARRYEHYLRLAPKAHAVRLQLIYYYGFPHAPDAIRHWHEFATVCRSPAVAEFVHQRVTALEAYAAEHGSKELSCPRAPQHTGRVLETIRTD
jgi:hypothetical protein